MKFLRNHLVTCITILIAVPVLLGIFFTDFNLFDTGLQSLVHIENNEIDELIAVFLIVIFGLIIDQMRARSRARAEIDEHRLRVLKATMRTVQDLVNNFLNNMQLFRMDAEEGTVSSDSLKLLDELILETSEKLTALGNSEVVSEIEMASGIGIQPQQLATERGSPVGLRH